MKDYCMFKESLLKLKLFSRYNPKYKLPKHNCVCYYIIIRWFKFCKPILNSKDALNFVGRRGGGRPS